MLALACPARAATSDYVRLHVIASDDTPAAQALKLEVRDAVLSRARALLEGVGDAETAWAIVNDNLDGLESAARAVCADAVCKLGVYPFPTRVYGGAVVPAGNYRALRVIIGEGKGHNWWCVLYPSMCYPEAWQSDGGALHSTLWRWLTSLFGGDRA